MSLKQSIKIITLKQFVIVSIVGIFALMALVAYNFKQLTIFAMKDKGESISKFVEASLVSHMNTLENKKKNAYIETIQKITSVNDLKIIHSKSVSEQFKLESHDKYFSDPWIADVFKNKKSYYIMKDLGHDKIIMRVVVPYIAGKNEIVNCLNCHNVPEGTVLGAIDFDLDISTYRSMSFTYLYMILTVLFLITFVIIYLFFKIIDKHVRYPLVELMVKTKKSFEKHIPIDTQQFESMEIEDLAIKINEFNHELLVKHDELRDKNYELIELNKEIEATQKEIIFTMGFVGETRSKETANHVIRVSEYSYILAKGYGLNDEECENILTSSPMHDIGKVGIPDSILNKPAKLTEDEFEVMKTHAELGYEIFKGSQRELLKAAAIIAHEHHEKWDGTGYPRALKGENIHIFGRIVALADVFDALGTKRVYKDAWDMEDILKYLENEKGKQFEPKLIDIFFNNLDAILEIKERYK